jgi:hypothetical protein
MIKNIRGNIRLYFASAWYSYRALYAWQTAGPYISGKIVFPIAQMLFFLYLGRMAGVQDPLYIVIGNILLLPATNGVAGISMTISGERDFRTLPYLIASPAPRGPLFLGRSLVHIIDGLLSTIAALILGAVFFHINLSHSNLDSFMHSLTLHHLLWNGFAAWQSISTDARSMDDYFNDQYSSLYFERG